MRSFFSLSEVRQAIDRSEIDLPGVVQSYIARIAELPHLNAFLEVYENEALAKAASIQTKINIGTAGKLAGMVIGIKDMISYKGHKLTASSRILENFVALYDSTVVKRLSEEDAIIIGRLNCDEFAMGGSNETSWFGAVQNYHDNTRVPGGSSGGSAVAVQAGLCLAALGTDTGGSVRQPASFCGVVGLKPTYSRVSRYGIAAFASSFDQVGTLTNCVEDAAVILEVIAGADGKDATASTQPVPRYLANDPWIEKKPRIAYFKEYMESDGLDLEIRIRTEELLEKLKDEGHEVQSISFSMLDYLVPAYYVLVAAEASSNLSRYDGVHFGYRSPNAHDLESTYKLSRSEGFGAEVRRRVMLGTFILSAGYYDAYYIKGQKVRRLIRDATLRVLEDFDFILTPTTPGTAFKLGEKTADPIVMYLSDIFNVQASLAGIPAISIPLDTHSNGLPYGLQIMGKDFSEDEMLSFARQIAHLNGSNAPHRNKKVTLS